MNKYSDNIIAMATPPGIGAISVFRLSGPDVIEITDKFFHPAGKKNTKLTAVAGHTLHFGELRENDELIDEVLVSVFKAPKSYTGENSVEISVHASPYIRQRVMNLFLQNGVRLAEPGEFTLRAFLHGKMDLAQAEAVADLIAAETELQHKAALHQLRGGFSAELKALRQQLLEFASLMELELDFAEEDVEFADREAFKNLLSKIKSTLLKLIEGFRLGNVVKSGVPVAIIGEPNTGKSTLLNTLLNEEKAIVTEIPGTTRDVIEDSIVIDGIKFRFIDTAGIRKAKDKVEQIGIERTFEKIKEARIVLFLTDAELLHKDTTYFHKNFERLTAWKRDFSDKTIVLLINKIDRLSKEELEELKLKIDAMRQTPVFYVSAKQRQGVDALKSFLSEQIQTGKIIQQDILITNVRHYDALRGALESIEAVEEGLFSGLTTDLLAVDIRDALNKLGEITGEITTDDLLDHIFKNFCIGK